jgi:ankyrin repeat protein
MAAWMIENGSDVHQGGDGPLMRAALDDDRIAMMELLLSYGADVNAGWNGNYLILCAPCETLAPRSLAWLLAHGADPTIHFEKYGSPLAMVVATYSRNAAGKQACLEVFAGAGFTLPDTPCVALARGRTDLLEAHLKQDPQLLSKRFAQGEIYPEGLGVRQGDGLTFTPLDGTTLLHQAVEFEDTRMAQWLLEKGADPNARAIVDSDGFGGHAPLHHTVISIGDRSGVRAKLLLDSGADPNLPTTFRKQLGDMGEPEKERMFEYHDATPIAFARQYQEPAWVNEAAIAEIVARGGR